MESYKIKYGNKPITLVIFGGLMMKPGIPIFEFENVASCLDVNRIYVRDLSQCWYMEGITNSSKEKNIINSISEMGAIMKQPVFKNTKKILIGNSSGGYASILFGISLVEIDKVIAFSPQTFLDKINRKKYKDNRFEKYILKVHNSKSINRYFFDLNEFKRKINIDIHYSSQDRLDSIHAQRIKNVNLYPYKIGNHNLLVKELKNNGTLIKILKKAIK